MVNKSRFSRLIALSFALTGITLLFLNLSISETSAQSSLETDQRSQQTISDELSNAAEHLVKERGIGIEEAKKRILWQDKAEELDAKLKDSIPSNDYGGTWIDDETDRVQIGILNNTEFRKSQRSTLEQKVADINLSDAVDYVSVTYSQEYLRSIKDKISASFVEDVGVSEWPAQFGIKISENKVEVGVLKDITKAAVEYQQFFSDLEKKYPGLISYHEIQGKIIAESDCNWWYCNSPLRGAVGLKGSADGYGQQQCTAGFNVVGNSGTRYVVTAGHCEPAGNGWATDTKNYTLKKIGPIKSGNGNLLDNPGSSKLDAMLIKIREDTYNWNVIGKVYVRGGTIGVNGVNPPSTNETYDITGSGSNTTSLEGSRVCISGAKSADLNYHEGGSCGRVKAVDIDIETCDAFGNNCNRVYKVTRASYCSRGGDSGAPVFRLGKAHGIHIASGENETVEHPNPVCHEDKFYTGMNPIINAFDSNISIF